MTSPIEVSELRFLVFQELEASTLRSLRLTCKGWYPEADQLLWSHVSKLVPLLRLMPEDAWTEDLSPRTYGGHDRKNFRFTRPLALQDWIPALKRSIFVKEQWIFHWDILRPAVCAESVVGVIIACPPPSVPLFPHMRYLLLNGMKDHVPAYQRLVEILYPQNMVTQIRGSADEADFFDPGVLPTRFHNLTTIYYLSLYDERFPRRDDVALTGADVAQRNELRTARTLAACPCLRDVRLYPANGAVAPWIIIALSCSTSIRRLWLDFQDLKNDEIRIPETYCFPRFPALRSFRTSQLTLLCARRLLNSGGRESVGEITIHQEPSIPGKGTLFVTSRDALLSIFRSLHDQYAPYRSLRSLSLEGTLPAMAFTFSDIQMFAVFPHITCFELDFEYAEILPRRGGGGGGYASPAVSKEPAVLTLRALLAFVERCPEFACLTLPMDATVVPTLQPDASGRPPRYWALEELVVQDTPIVSGDEVGAWMAATFPGLRKVVYYIPEVDSEEEEEEGEEEEEMKLPQALPSGTYGVPVLHKVPEEYDDDADWRWNEWQRVKKTTTGKSANV
ncbi:uncharacterized protein SCHCODRAFT_02667501 [Schizophyllum commune H4-8]|nr:uncharacterized protein SCHCODRAFT_02667501 [Schizophyllum commune H4-8]KAI5891934.1 hypothetical protein SCHCODRAFT_02667501 [Schizophyllum commune H4-8]